MTALNGSHTASPLARSDRMKDCEPPGLSRRGRIPLPALENPEMGTIGPQSEIGKFEFRRIRIKELP